MSALVVGAVVALSGAGPARTTSGAMIAGSLVSTAYPPTAPAPKPGAKTRVGPVITLSRTASAIATGMDAEETLPIVSMLK
jgi:hypothetical protein